MITVYSSFTVEERVLKVIDESGIELFPFEIARKVHANRSSVRVIIRISLRCCVSEDVLHWVVDEFVGGVKLHVCFGSERRKISGYIACDLGMSHDACLFALNRWFDIAEARLGRAFVDLELTTFEVNKDYFGVRVDGVQCVMKKGLFDMVEQIYQKEENLVRREWKISQPMSMNAFEAALQKGVAEHDRTQATFELSQDVKRVSEALKFNNSRLLQVEKLQEASFRFLSKSADGVAALAKVKDIEGKITALHGDLARVVDALGKLVDFEGSSQEPKTSADGGKSYVS